MIFHLVQRGMRHKDRHTHRQSDYYRHSNWSDELTNQKGPQIVATTQSWVEADTEPLQGLRAKAIIAMSGFLTNSLHVFNKKPCLFLSYPATEVLNLIQGKNLCLLQSPEGTFSVSFLFDWFFFLNFKFLRVLCNYTICPTPFLSSITSNPPFLALF